MDFLKKNSASNQYIINKSLAYYYMPMISETMILQNFIFEYFHTMIP